MIRAILAADRKGGIGKNGGLPWPKNSEDLAWFKNHTQGHVVVMGSTTWESGIPKPLPRRINCVISRRDPALFPEVDHVITTGVVQGLTDLESEFPDLIIWVIGGAKIIEQALPVIEEFYLTRIDGDYECDTFLNIKDIETKFKKAHSLKSPGGTFEIWKNTKRL